jgi:hypothetical protein
MVPGLVHAADVADCETVQAESGVVDVDALVRLCTSNGDLFCCDGVSDPTVCRRASGVNMDVQKAEDRAPAAGTRRAPCLKLYKYFFSSSPFPLDQGKDREGVRNREPTIIGLAAELGLW